VDFPGNSLDVIHFSYLVFLEDLNCDFLVCEQVDALFDFAEGALT
jgi:hypothetical protein